MSKFTILVLALLAIAAGAFALSEKDSQDAFVDFMQTYQISYSSDEFLYRYRVFQGNLAVISAHNSKPVKSFTMKVNKLADLTDEEYRFRMLGYRGPPRKTVTNENIKVNLPESVDWVKEGRVTPMKDQGACGSCWAFSAVGAMEGLIAKDGPLVGLSEQQLVDCSRPYGNYGCNGGLMEPSFQYVIDNKGIEAEKDYPYESGTGNDRFQCRFKNAYATISGYKHVSGEQNLQEAIANVGPIAVAIDAGQSSFRFYEEGVYDEPNCSPFLNHAVLATGYGTENGVEYYMVKNSWGERWGDNGYIKMSRNKNNQCGIASDASYPTK